MMQHFRTEINIPESPFKISYGDKIMMMGSCFTEHIGAAMERLLFRVDVNPFGIVYNPVSLTEGLNVLLENREFTKDDLICYNESWHSFMHHGRFSGGDPDKCLENINGRLCRSGKFIREAEYLFMTFGTAFIYRYKKTGKIVSNCHKLPAQEFERSMAGADEIVMVVKETVSSLYKANPGIKIIFTVSPVRHLKDGAVGNQLSKSTLIIAIHKILEEIPGTSYFPSYEIMMDDLRDYRFYDDDMVHPAGNARSYIQEKYADVYFSEETKKLVSDIEKIVRAKEHRPYHPEGNAYMKFLVAQIEQIKELGSKNLLVDTRQLKEYFEEKLKKVMNKDA
ncbi:MAG: GSCFA domain-containing protein [Bacteroidota bacterium]